MNKCQRCGSRFDPAFSPSSLVCGECSVIVEGEPIVRLPEAAQPAAEPEACPACGTLLEEPEHDPTCPLFTNEEQ